MQILHSSPEIKTVPFSLAISLKSLSSGIRNLTTIYQTVFHLSIRLSIELHK